MTLAHKLNLRDGMKLNVVAKPAGMDLDDVTVTRGAAQGVLVFVRDFSEFEATCDLAVEAARADRLSWIAYPKAGQRGTDLNRDVLRRRLMTRGVRGVRQVAIDDMWSAIRFRSKK